MLLVAGMLGVPLVSLVKVDDAVPGVQVEASARQRPLDLDRGNDRDVSRGRVELVAAEIDTTEPIVVTTTAPPTTVAPTTTAAPTTTHVHPSTTTTHVHPSTTTTAKPTTTTAKPKPTTTTAPTTTAAPRTQEGDASYYDTSDPAECAHRTLAFGTVVTVTNLENGRQTTCRVGDRGPFVEGRVIDLSSDRFAELAPLSDGVIRVRIEW